MSKLRAHGYLGFYSILETFHTIILLLQHWWLSFLTVDSALLLLLLLLLLVIVLFVCRLQNFDFQALEEAAGYDGGFTARSTTVRYKLFYFHSLCLLKASLFVSTCSSSCSYSCHLSELYVHWFQICLLIVASSCTLQCVQCYLHCCTLVSAF